ncbi:DHA2 family efflux MFS transporter permease subunit [Corynebacterium lizhenjunii]|uniref:DHA2 family efflux MFS transporter permease subunit n=1 Tax=Corynebacterium lizhenjunii TaxID=2709394 RepID=A0A7T0PAM5_9CORY|nr:DHA2 family efflux MFS transporter permease subunit [Corynebacterium lizhenjunii]QPK80038.1 DHA2 family efflux MFS transporter permease subunit [Corynebacterium lizhenjunii]
MIDSPDTRSSDVLPARDAWKAMFALSLGFFVSVLDQSLVAVALPGIQADFAAGVLETLWVSSAYLLAVVVPLLVTGRLGDVVGNKQMFLIGVSVFGLGALACAFAPSIGILIAARAVQGLGAAMQMPQTMAVINRIFPRERRGRALGVWGVVGSVAALTGPLLGGVLVELFSWHAVFWIHVPVVVVALLVGQRWIPRLPTFARRIDIPSVLLSAAGLGMLVYGIQQGIAQHGSVMFGAVIALAAFMLRQRALERKKDASAMDQEPLVPLELFSNRNYAAGTVGIVSMGFMAAAIMLPVMLWLQQIRGIGAGEAGLMVAPMAVISLGLSPVAGILADKLDPRRLASMGFIVLLAATAGLVVAVRADAAVGWVSVAALGLGVGQSFIWGTNSATAMRDVQPALLGAASGVYNLSRQVGAVIGVAGVSAALQAGTVAGSPHAGVAGAFMVIALALVVGFVASLFFRNTLAQPAAAKRAR